MKNLYFIVMFLCTAIIPSAALADDNVHDGRPCLSGVCVGDEISALSKVKWLPPSVFGQPISLKINDAQIKILQKHFAPSAAAVVRAAAPYLNIDSFDNKAIPRLAKVKGICEPFNHQHYMYIPPDAPFALGGGKPVKEPSFADQVAGEYILTDMNRMEGYFLSESGHRTKVVVALALGKDPAWQSLRVASIQRFFPNEYTNDQMVELSKQLKERYQGVAQVNGNWPSPTEPNWSLEGKVLTLNAATVKYTTQAGDHLKQYPGCSKSLKVD